jgi:hypothetical protein
MRKRIPKFRSVQEEAQFWDTHDTTDYLDEFEDDNEIVFVRPEHGIIEVGSTIWQRLLREAKRRRTTPSRLVNRWLKEHLKAG